MVFLAFKDQSFVIKWKLAKVVGRVRKLGYRKVSRNQVWIDYLDSRVWCWLDDFDCVWVWVYWDEFDGDGSVSLPVGLDEAREEVGGFVQVAAGQWVVPLQQGLTVKPGKKIPDETQITPSFLFSYEHRQIMSPNVFYELTSQMQPDIGLVFQASTFSAPFLQSNVSISEK